jgi:hypothetical protein
MKQMRARIRSAALLRAAVAALALAAGAASARAASPRPDLRPAAMPPHDAAPPSRADDAAGREAAASPDLASARREALASPDLSSLGDADGHAAHASPDLPQSDTQETAVEMAGFSPAGGTIAVGETAVSALRLRTRSATSARVWVGYSVRDAGGAWHDIPSLAVAVPAGDTVRAALRWRVPAAAAPGPATVVMAAWDAPPETGTARRLLRAERVDAFVVAPARAAAGTAVVPAWTAGAHRLGRGRLRPANVRADGDGTRLVLPAGRPDGAQLASAGRHAQGSFRVRMRTARAPGSLSALFLYEDVPGHANDEVDIEVFNDGSGRVLLSTWRDGRLTRSEERELGFDPSAAEHEYRIDWRPGEVRFLVDGRLLRAWRDGVPHRPMKLMANAWWPTWLEGAPPAADAATVVRGLSAHPFPADAERR